ncbi:MAG: hypothetical protein KGJ80_14370, partial [Chloroflexota bacterium]|nr:hypothetical protein [Chloroflexota bacterium]
SIPADLKSKLQYDPSAVVRLIVRLKDDPESRVAAVQAHGLTVRHTYSLISAVAVEGTAAASLTLANEAWVLSVEEDKQVHTM